jgi:hypothetical protein
METCKTFDVPEAAAAMLLGFRLAASGVKCEVRIDGEEPQTVLVDLADDDAEGVWFEAIRQFKADLSETEAGDEESEK